MPNHDFLLYGANGYTGRLIARLSSEYGLEPLLAGRNEAALSALGRELGLPWRRLELNDRSALDSAVQDCRLVLHAAGPFRYTLRPMIEACLRNGRHYIDINGDISCFEESRTFDGSALEKGIMIMPGAGFDVIPTDCLAAFLSREMPDATRLRIAFASLGSTLSHGTAMTMAGKLGEGGMIRKEGIIVKRPFGENGMEVDMGDGKRFVMSIPWGDISTAFHTTGIPNIETFTSVKPVVHRIMKLQFLFNGLLRSERVRNIIRRKIDSRSPGPDDQMRRQARSLVWAEVSRANGDTCTATLKGPEVYDMTAHGALLITKKILSGQFKPGYQTPAGCYGPDLVLGIPGVSRNGPHNL